MSQNCKIIAEIGVNHDGDIGIAHELIDAAVDVGADAVKFQCFSARELVAEDTDLANYQRARVADSSQYEMLKRLELAPRDFVDLQSHCKNRSIEFLSTAFDEGWLDFLVGIGVAYLKWPSGELTNHSFLEYAASKDIPILLSTGMASLEEVEQAFDCVQRVWHSSETMDVQEHLTILHCTSLYPAPIETLNVAAIETLKARFGTPVGYSDHSEGIVAAVMSVALGASVIEKHLTYDRGASGPDHSASLDPDEFQEYVNAIREAETARGSRIKRPNSDEHEVANLARKSLFAKRHLRSGSKLGVEDLIARRPGTGIGADCMAQLLGKEVTCDVSAGEMLSWEHFKQ